MESNVPYGSREYTYTGSVADAVIQDIGCKGCGHCSPLALYDAEL